MYGAMRGEYPLPLVRLENGLALVPSCLDLSAAESELINEPGRELILKGLIAKVLDTHKFDKRKTLNKSVSEIINESFCDKVFKTVIRDNVALAEAPIKGRNIFEYNKNCNGTQDYMSLAQEVLKLK